MPTARPRHQVTETEPVARAIDSAAQRWPGVSRAQLVVRLIEAGAESIEAAAQQAREHRAALIKDAAVRFAEAYPADYLDQVRSDWPA